MEEGKKTKKSKRPTASFVTGAIALVFLIIGYEVALFVHRAAVLRIEANRDNPDTVFIVDPALAKKLLAEDMLLSAGPESAGAKNRADAPADSGPAGSIIVRKNAPHSKAVKEYREKYVPRKVESFRFNPNTATLEELQRLGFSEAQAQAIDNYRQKGGRFRRPADFAKSYVVADTVFARLEPFIDIPLLDINKADSVALLDLPGIGPYFAGKVVQYRSRLQGYSCKEQLMEIYRFDQEKYDGLKDLISCSEPAPYPLWTLREGELAKHPYISREEAHGIVLFREHNAPENCSVEGLKKAGVLSEEHAGKLSVCRILSPAP